MLESFLDPEWLASLLPVAQQTEVKVWAIKVAVVWGLVELRTKKRFEGVEAAATKLEAAVGKLVNTITRVEDADKASTKIINQRLDEEFAAQSRLEIFLQSLGKKVTVIEQTLELKTNDREN